MLVALKSKVVKDILQVGTQGLIGQGGPCVSAWVDQFRGRVHPRPFLMYFLNVEPFSNSCCFTPRASSIQRLRGFASKVRSVGWTQSVPPRGSGWVRSQSARQHYRCACTHPLPRGGTDCAQVRCGRASIATCALRMHPPLPQGGTDCIQVKVLTFEAKPGCELS